MQVGADPLLTGTLQLQDLCTFNGSQICKICLLAFQFFIQSFGHKFDAQWLNIEQ